MIEIELKPEHAEAIHRHGEETFPNECCGFMLGTDNGTGRRVLELQRANNDREQEAQRNRFLIDPREYMKCEKAAGRQGMVIVGFYHSHPNAPARPSQYDLEHAWPWCSYVIVSVQDGKADKMTSWRLREDRAAFDEEAIRVAVNTGSKE